MQLREPRSRPDRLTEWSEAQLTLRDHLRRQLLLSQMGERDRALAHLVIDALDDDGYLKLGFDELAALVLAEHEVEPEDLAAALRLVQTLEPAGVGARTLQECLLLQLQALPAGTTGLAIALKLVGDHFPPLAAREFVRLHQLLGCSDSDLHVARNLIRTLNPKPGLRFGPGDTRYVVPDIVVSKIVHPERRARRRGAAAGGFASRDQRRRHRRRHPAGGPRPRLRALPPGRRLHHAPLRRSRAGARDLQASDRAARRYGAGGERRRGPGRDLQHPAAGGGARDTRRRTRRRCPCPRGLPDRGPAGPEDRRGGRRRRHAGARRQGAERLRGAGLPGRLGRLGRRGATARRSGTAGGAADRYRDAELDGYGLLRQLRALGGAGAIPAIALTAFARAEDRMRALREGFRLHLAKPVEPAELVATVASVAGRPAGAGEGRREN